VGNGGNSTNPAATAELQQPIPQPRPPASSRIWSPVLPTCRP
jgi:hypothetical protein